jgi:Nuclease-related domain
MSLTGLWPREQSRPTDSQAEHRVYAALSRTLPKGWTAWHSLRVRTEQGYEGEGDYALAIPGKGFLVLEVKGGAARDARRSLVSKRPSFRQGSSRTSSRLRQNAPFPPERTWLPSRPLLPSFCLLG